MAVTTLVFPFVMGLDQTVDDRLLEPGRPRAIENLAIRKKGRLGMRYDYDSLAVTVQGTGTLNLYDLVGAAGRLWGIGETSPTAFSPQSPSDLIEYVNQPLYAWRTTTSPGSTSVNPKLPIASYPTAIGRVSRRSPTVVNMDVAAGSGRVCAVWQIDTATPRVAVHIIDAATDATIFYEEIQGFIFPRVVCTGTKFFIGCTNTTATTPKLFRFDPAVDTTLTALTDPAGAGGAINSFDMSLSHEGTTFWMAYGRAGPLTRIHGFDANGTETHDFAGPAVLCFFITVFTEAVSAGVVRIHLACVINATNAVNLSTYLGATSALETNTAAKYTGATSQVGLCVLLGALILAVFQQGSDVDTESYENSTHITGQSTTYSNCRLNSKALSCRSHSLFALRLVEATDGASTHVLAQCMTRPTQVTIPVAVADRLIAMACNVAELPNLAFDAARQRFYWIRSVQEASLVLAQPAVMELSIARQDRRQVAALGDALYIAGAITTVHDGRNVTEANFVDRPVFTITGQSVVGGAFLDALGVYQFVAVFESIDAHGNRVQSPPSDVVTGTLTGANNRFSWSVTGPHTLRVGLTLPDVLGDVDSPPSTVIYRTKNNAGGNLTFYRDTFFTSGVSGASGTGFSEQADSTLELNEILYTQGDRGALSGPLPFVAPEGCGSIAASADRILTGALPAQSRIQESRGLFPSEQANWSDAIGFIRDTRGRVLAVARLDERRIIFTAFELFEMDGPGLDDNGNGDLGAPRRLPSPSGLHGGELGWRSIVECSLGILFQGQVDMIYLLPRGGTTPQPIGDAVQDKLAAFPVITSATHLPLDRTVRFTCNNVAGTDSIQLLYDVGEQAWIVEGPFGFPIASSAAYQNRMTILGNNVVRQQRASHPPVAIIANAWRSGDIHGGKLGGFFHFLNVQYYGEFHGDCLLRAIARFDDNTSETLPLCEVNAAGLAALANSSNSFLATYSVVTNAVGAPFSAKFVGNQIKCECVRVDFEVEYPFPCLVGTNTASDTTASNDVIVTLSSQRAAGDRVIIAMMISSAGAAAPTAAGWTQILTNTTADGRQAVFERLLDGSEAATVTFTWAGTAAAAFTLAWTIRNVHQSGSSEANSVSPNNPAATTANGAPLTPSWGALNTLWLTVLAIDNRLGTAPSNVIRQPRDFRRGINSAFTSSNPLLSGQIIGGDRPLNAASLSPTESPTAWGYTDPSDSRSITIAIRPNVALVSEGLVHHYWTMDVEGTDKSALKSPLQLKG